MYKNKDEERKYQREWKRNKYADLSPEEKKKYLDRAKKWHRDNVEKARESKRVYELKKHNEVFDLLGRSCVRCGFSDIRALQIDHVNGGGSQERKSMKGRRLYNHILSVGGIGYQILCANCNWIKRIENKECAIRI